MEEEWGRLMGSLLGRVVEKKIQGGRRKHNGAEARW